jgi:hypothetical protein
MKTTMAITDGNDPPAFSLCLRTAQQRLCNGFTPFIIDCLNHLHLAYAVSWVKTECSLVASSCALSRAPNPVLRNKQSGEDKVNNIVTPSVSARIQSSSATKEENMTPDSAEMHNTTKPSAK